MENSGTSQRTSGGKVGPAVRMRIIEAAGAVFAAKGFEKATSREICERAGVNAAAVNYHFGGVEALYGQVIAEAHRRVTAPDMRVMSALAGAVAEERLLAVVCDIATRIARPLSQSWEVRVLSREFVSPSTPKDQIDATVEPHRQAMKALVAQALNCEADDPKVGYVLLFVISPCLVLAIANASAAHALFPGVANEKRGAIESLVRHFRQFVSAGLRACVAETQITATERVES